MPDVGLSLSGNLDMVTSEVLNETFERLDEVQMRSLTISIGAELH